MKYLIIVTGGTGGCIGGNNNDVIFNCVKSYSIDDIIPIIKSASHENSIIIPIMNCYDIPAKEMLQQGNYRKTFKELREVIKQIGNKLKIELDVDITEANLKIVHLLNPDTTASI